MKMIISHESSPQNCAATGCRQVTPLRWKPDVGAEDYAKHHVPDGTFLYVPACCPDHAETGHTLRKWIKLDPEKPPKETPAVVLGKLREQLIPR